MSARIIWIYSKIGAARLAMIKMRKGNLMGEAVKQYLCLTEGSFKDFQHNSVILAILIRALYSVGGLEFFLSFCFKTKSKCPSA